MDAQVARIYGQGTHGGRSKFVEARKLCLLHIRPEFFLAKGSKFAIAEFPACELKGASKTSRNY